MLLPTSAGEFTARAFECPSGAIHLALVSGELGDGDRVLTRVHSECVTGDALGSLKVRLWSPATHGTAGHHR